MPVQLCGQSRAEPCPPLHTKWTMFRSKTVLVLLRRSGSRSLRSSPMIFNHVWIFVVLIFYLSLINLLPLSSTSISSNLINLTALPFGSLSLRVWLFTRRTNFEWWTAFGSELAAHQNKRSHIFVFVLKLMAVWPWPWTLPLGSLCDMCESRVCTFRLNIRLRIQWTWFIMAFLLEAKPKSVCEYATEPHPTQFHHDSRHTNIYCNQDKLQIGKNCVFGFSFSDFFFSLLVLVVFVSKRRRN